MPQNRERYPLNKVPELRLIFGGGGYECMQHNLQLFDPFSRGLLDKS